jgi:hypothetical protein
MKPTKWKLNTAAHVFGVSRTKLRSRLEAAGIPTGAGREFTTRQISRALYADANIQTAKYRRESAEADLAEIEVAKARRELAATADVVDILARVLRAFRKRLADLPANLGPAVNPSDPAHGTAAVRRWVDGVLPLLREDIVAVFAKGDLPNDDDEQEAEG